MGIWVDRDVAFALSRDSALEVESDVELDEIVTEPRDTALFCPRCEIYLTEQEGMNLPQGLHIDYCPGCHGFWFDKGELMIYKTYLEEKRIQNKERMRQSEAKKKEDRRRKDGLKKTLELGGTTFGAGYHPGITLARQLINLWRFLR